MGGHPRCLEYADALLAGGHARYPDVSARLAETAKRWLGNAQADHDVEAYFDAHTTLDHALAEVATLASDEVLLDALLADLADVPGAHRVLLGVSVFRRPVDENAVLIQVGRREPDEPADTVVESATAGRPRQPRRSDLDIVAAVHACTNASLLTLDALDSAGTIFVHRWTATALERRWVSDGWGMEIVDAHLRAAYYWRWRCNIMGRSPVEKIDDLREAVHHYEAALERGHEQSRIDLATTCRKLEDRLDTIGRRREALTFCLRAFAEYRVLADTRPEQYTSVLAGANDLSISLSAVGQRSDALMMSHESVDLYRDLASSQSSPTAGSVSCQRTTNGTRPVCRPVTGESWPGTAAPTGPLSCPARASTRPAWSCSSAPSRLMKPQWTGTSASKSTAM